MKRLLIATPLLALGLSGVLPITSASATGTGAMSISVLKSTGPSHIKLGRSVTFHVRVSGITLVARIGKKPVPGHGHIQVYLNHIPKDAHRKFDRRHWLGSQAATIFSLGFPKGIVPGKGKYKILIALAKNNNVLYHVTPAVFKLTVK